MKTCQDSLKKKKKKRQQRVTTDFREVLKLRVFRTC